MSLRDLRTLFELAQKSPEMGRRLADAQAHALREHDVASYAETIMKMADEHGLDVDQSDLDSIIRVEIDTDALFRDDDDVAYTMAIPEDGPADVPRVTTMALGEEDGNGRMRPPRRPDDVRNRIATTCAIPEDGPRR